jgi:hypothetical protein
MERLNGENRDREKKAVIKESINPARITDL